MALADTQNSAHKTDAGLLRQFYWHCSAKYRKLLWDLRRPDHVTCGITRRTMFLNRADPRSLALWRSRGNVNARALQLWQRVLGLRPWTLVLDVGANHGEMLLNVQMPPGARVFAFEPNPQLAALLRRSCAANNLAATIVEAAVGEAAGEVTLHIDRNWSGTSSVLAPASDAGIVPVRVAQVALTDFLAAHGFPPAPASVAMKIDVEGYEPAALRGMLGSLGHWSDLMIVIEIQHLDAEALAEIERHFDIAVADRNGKLARRTSGAADAGQYDAVLVRKGELDRFTN